MLHRLRSTRRTPRPPDRLRVAIVAESFLPSVNGVTNSVLRLLDHLALRGHEALVIAPGPGPDHVGATPVVRVRALDLPRYDSLRVGLPVFKLVSALRDFDADVVHLAAPTVLGAAGARAARALDIPSVAVFQTDIAGFAKRYGLGVATPMIWAWLRWVHAQSALTLAPSSSTAWMLRGHGIDRVDIWGRGVDLERFHPSQRSPLLRRSFANDDEVVVGYVGRLAREKQVHRLRPLLDLPGARVVVVGDGPDRAHLQRLLPGATFTGMRHGADLARHHATLDLFVHTGLDDTFCQSVQEALASGVPVVAPAVGGPLDLVRHGVNGFLWSPEQPDTLRGAVGDLVSSPELRRTLGAAGRAGVAGRSWAVVMDELLEHYRRVVGSDQRPVDLAA